MAPERPASPAMRHHDLTAMETIDEETVLRALETRFLEEREIYTAVGPSVMIKVNPFEDVDGEKRNGTGSSPHVACLAERARENAIATRRPQSVMMTGESGSGKTEATKVYIKTLIEGDYCANTSLQVKLMDACTLLESFGNCVTPHNHNSSRFARYFEVFVDSKREHVVRGEVKQYLLEKSRVVSGTSDSSNFHVFHDLCAAFREQRCDEAAVEQPPQYFKYLRDRVDSTKEGRYASMEAQLMRLGVSEGNLCSLESLLWAILHLGNLEFQDTDTGGCTVATPTTLKHVASLLGMPDENTVSDLFCKQHLKMGRELVTRHRTSQQARDVRDALAKHLYSNLFLWIVRVVNENIQQGHRDKRISRSLDLVSIGILDIFGFECFENNSFEQFCINYCNEKLVSLFHRVLVATELDVCQEEGVPMETLDVSQEYELACELKARTLEGIHSALSIVQDEIRVPKSTDTTLASKLSKLDLAEEPVAKHKKVVRLGGLEAFRVKHYAGHVAYDLNGWLDKNKDEGPIAFLQALESDSSVALIRGVLENQTSDCAVKNKKSIGVKFREEFGQLANRIAESDQQFVMCLKPNRRSNPRDFDKDLVLRQLECNGTLTICNVRKGGFAAHMCHHAFLERYFLVEPAFEGTAFQLAETFVQRGMVPERDIFVGKTRILLKSAAVQRLENRLGAMQRSATLIQSMYRGYTIRFALHSVKASLIVVQSVVRRHLAIRSVMAMKKEKTAIVKVQAYVRMYLQRQTLRNKALARRATIKVQSACRYFLARFARAAVRKRLEFRKEQELLRLKLAACTLIQGAIRSFLARRSMGRHRALKALEDARAAKCHAAAALTQSVVRRWLAHSRVRKARAEKPLSTTCGAAAAPPVSVSQKSAEALEPKCETPSVQCDMEKEDFYESLLKLVDTQAKETTEERSTAGSQEAPDLVTSNLDNEVLLARPTLPYAKRRKQRKRTWPALGSCVTLKTSPETTPVRSIQMANVDEQENSLSKANVSRSVKGEKAEKKKKKKRSTSTCSEKDRIPTTKPLWECESVVFLKQTGKTEEAFYEEKAREDGSFRYLIPDYNTVAIQASSRISINSCRNVLRKALRSREIGELMYARNVAKQAAYGGAELDKVEATIAHIRKIHMKQVEAEAQLAKKYGWACA